MLMDAWQRDNYEKIFIKRCPYCNRPIFTTEYSIVSKSIYDPPIYRVRTKNLDESEVTYYYVCENCGGNFSYKFKS